MEIGGSGTCYSDASAVTKDGTLIAENPGKLCQGDTWVIEPTDLVPVEDASKTPTPSP